MSSIHEYPRPATVLRVVDGDTFDVQFDLGFGVTKKERLRIAGYDAPELGTSPGVAARTALSDALGDYLRKVFVTTRKTDKYGRYLALMITVDERDILPALVGAGHLKPWDGHGAHPA